MAKLRFVLLVFGMGWVTSSVAGTYGAENWGEMYWGDNPVSAPTSAPTILSAVATEEDITITLDGIAQGTGEDGWSAITSYIVTCGTESVEANEGTVVISGLEGDTKYSCSVSAVNASGEGPAALQVVTTEAALEGMNFILVCAAIDCQTT